MTFTFNVYLLNPTRTDVTPYTRRHVTLWRSVCRLAFPIIDLNFKVSQLNYDMSSTTDRWTSRCTRGGSTLIYKFKCIRVSTEKLTSTETERFTLIRGVLLLLLIWDALYAGIQPLWCPIAYRRHIEHLLSLIGQVVSIFRYVRMQKLLDSSL